MYKRMAVAVLLAFAATSASADHAVARSGGGHSGRPSGGHVGGGRSSGGHSSGGHLSVGRVFSGGPSRSSVSAGRSSSARVTRGYSTGSRDTSSGGGRAYYGGGRAVPRGSFSQPPRTGTQYRHPRAGYGTGYSRGRGYGYGYGRGSSYGYRSYGYRSYGYGRSYYGRYPYYYGYSPYYGWGGLGLSFSLGGYPYAGGYYAPYYDDSYVSDEPYDGGGSARDEDYYDRDDARDEGRAEGAELQLIVLPDDASVWIDGEFRGVARGTARLGLPPGRHQIEIVRPGYRTAARDVELRDGASVSVRIELTRP
jgi:PEGA domain